MILQLSPKERATRENMRPFQVMTYRDCPLYPELACYLLTVMRKAFQSFAWGQSSFNETILKNVEISLPVKRGDCKKFCVK